MLQRTTWRITYLLWHTVYFIAAKDVLVHMKTEHFKQAVTIPSDVRRVTVSQILDIWRASLIVSFTVKRTVILADQTSSSFFSCHAFCHQKRLIRHSNTFDNWDWWTCLRLSLYTLAVTELDTGRVHPRIGSGRDVSRSGRVQILGKSGGSDRVRLFQVH